MKSWIVILTSVFSFYAHADKIELLGEVQDLIVNVMDKKDAEADAKIADLKRRNLLPQAYLLTLETGENCNEQALEKIALAGGYATIDDATSQNFLHSIVECLRLDPVKFCSSKSEARHKECVDAYLTKATWAIQNTVQQMEMSRSTVTQSKSKDPFFDKMHAMFLSNIWARLAIRNQEVLKLRESETARCKEKGGAACAAAARIDAMQSLGKSNFAAVQKELKQWPTKRAPVKKAVSEFRERYPLIWQ